MTVKQILLLPLVVLMPLLATAEAAEEGTVEATIPWDGEGKIYKANTTTLLFLGSLKGIMYVESASGDMNEAIVVCPIMQQLDMENGKTFALGHCEIATSPENVVYARMACEGKLGGGACEGEFELTDGEGRFAGISGSGRLRVRSPLRRVVADLASGTVIRVATGLATISELNYSIP